MCEVLEPRKVLVFKWNKPNIKVSKLLKEKIEINSLAIRTQANRLSAVLDHLEKGSEE